MNTKSRKRLCSALAEPDIAKTRGLSHVEDIVNRIRYIMPCEIVNAEVPESRSVGTRVNGLLRVLVASVVP
jgi:hypothetical protein